MKSSSLNKEVKTLLGKAKSGSHTEKDTKETIQDTSKTSMEDQSDLIEANITNQSGTIQTITEHIDINNVTGHLLWQQKTPNQTPFRVGRYK